MTEGKRISLDEMFAGVDAERRAQIAREDAYESTPQGKAKRAERDSYNQRMREADERYAAEHPTDYHQQGRDEREAGASRAAPDDLTMEQADEWLAGWDSLGSDDDDES